MLCPYMLTQHTVRAHIRTQPRDAAPCRARAYANVFRVVDPPTSTLGRALECTQHAHSSCSICSITHYKQHTTYICCIVYAHRRRIFAIILTCIARARALRQHNLHVFKYIVLSPLLPQLLLATVASNISTTITSGFLQEYRKRLT